MWLSFIGSRRGRNPQCRATPGMGAGVGKPYPRMGRWRIVVHGACGQAALVPKGIGAMKKRPDGLTLLELMATLGLVTAGLTLGLPAFSGLIERTRVTTTFHLVSASLMSARAAAVTRGHPVTVCPSRDGRVCRNDPVWEEGWIIFADRGRLDSPVDETSILRRVDPIGGGITVRGTRGRLRVRYLPNG